jgi:hypothetical protein
MKTKKPPNRKRSAGKEKGEPQHKAETLPGMDASEPRGLKKTPKSDPQIYDRKVGCKTENNKKNESSALKTLHGELAPIYHEVGVLCKRAIKVVFVKCLPETIEVTLYASNLVMRIAVAILNTHPYMGS